MELVDFSFSTVFFLAKDVQGNFISKVMYEFSYKKVPIILGTFLKFL